MLKFSRFEIAANPMFITSASLQQYLLPLIQDGIFWNQPKTIKEVSKEQADILSQRTGFKLSIDYSDQEQNEALAYYFAYGTLMYDDYPWYFNTKSFLNNFKSAEANPSIIAHFMHINSGGGLAYFLDVVHREVSNRQKPLVVQCEMNMCSAALYLGSPANKLNCTTQNDIVGSIGTMISFWDLKPYFEKAGFKWHEHYAEQSDFKNKRFNDLLDGNPDDFIKYELNPLAEQFIANIKLSRPEATGEELFRGQTYSASEALDMKLIDAIQPITESIAQAYTLGKDYAEKQKIQNNIKSFI